MNKGGGSLEYQILCDCHHKGCNPWKEDFKVRGMSARRGTDLSSLSRKGTLSFPRPETENMPEMEEAGGGRRKATGNDAMG